MKTAKFVEVIIKDGNRIMNIECRADRTVREVLEFNQYKWVTDSVLVNGQQMTDYTLDIPFSQFVIGMVGELPRVTVCMIAPKEELPKKNTNKKEET